MTFPIPFFHPATAVPAGDPYWGNVILLMHGEGAGFVDSSSYAHSLSITYGAPYDGATISATQAKFGSTSIHFDSQDIVTGPTDNVFKLDGDFTIEAWIYLESSSSHGQFLYLYDSGGKDVRCGVNTTSADMIYGDQGVGTGTTPNNVGRWAFFAAVRDGTDIKVSIDGVFGSPVTVGTVPGTTITCFVQTADTGTVALYVDELRITKGVARYTGDFTPPTAAFPDS